MLMGAGGLLTPVVIAAFSRDRTLMAMISGAKEDMTRQVKDNVDPLHDRVNRVRDEYVRRDDMDGHLARLDKRFDEFNQSMLRNNAHVEKRLDEIATLIRGR